MQVLDVLHVVCDLTAYMRYQACGTTQCRNNFFDGSWPDLLVHAALWGSQGWAVNTAQGMRPVFPLVQQQLGYFGVVKWLAFFDVLYKVQV